LVIDASSDVVARRCYGGRAGSVESQPSLYRRAGWPAGAFHVHPRPSLATALLPDGWDAVLKLLPSNAAEAFTSRLPSDNLLGSGAGMAVFAIWVVLTPAGAAAALKGRDA
jgi:hypothetical protein